MAITVLAAALLILAPPLPPSPPSPPSPPPPPEPIPTARQLYDSCRSWVDTKAERTGFRNGGTVATDNLCQRATLGLMTDAGDTANAPDGRAWVDCIPEEVTNGFDPAVTMGEAYMRYLDARPADRDTANGHAVFRLAMRQAWPCRR